MSVTRIPLFGSLRFDLRFLDTNPKGVWSPRAPAGQPPCSTSKITVFPFVAVVGEGGGSPFAVAECSGEAVARDAPSHQRDLQPTPDPV